MLRVTTLKYLLVLLALLAVAFPMFSSSLLPRRRKAWWLDHAHRSWLDQSLGEGSNDTNSNSVDSCLEIGAIYPQPYTDEYRIRNADADARAPEGPPAFFRWSGWISRQQFDRVDECDDCDEHARCMVFFKILAGKVYVRKSGTGWDKLWNNPTLEVRYRAAVEMLIVAVHVFHVRDVDFVMNFEDRLSCGVPAMAYSVDPSCDQAGFAVPSWTAYIEARGREQLNAVFSCLDARYPPQARIPKAVWRGSTTGSVLTASNYMTNARVRLAVLGQFISHIADIGLSSHVQVGRFVVSSFNLLTTLRM